MKCAGPGVPAVAGGPRPRECSAADGGLGGNLTVGGARKGRPGGTRGERPPPGTGPAADAVREEAGRRGPPDPGQNPAVSAQELVDPAGRIHDLLRTGVERMALRAHVEMELLLQGGACPERVPAATGDGELAVLGMDVGFHGLFSCKGARFGAAESIPDSGPDRVPVPAPPNQAPEPAGAAYRPLTSRHAGGSFSPRSGARRPGTGAGLRRPWRAPDRARVPWSGTTPLRCSGRAVRPWPWPRCYARRMPTTLAVRGVSAAISSQNLTASASTVAHSSSGIEVSSSFVPSTRSFASPPQYQYWR